MTTTATPQVYLIKRSCKVKGEPGKAWELRWPGSDGSMKSERIGYVAGECAPSVETISEHKAKSMRRKKELDFNSGSAVFDRTRLTVQEFLQLDREAIWASVRPATIRVHRVASQHLIDAIGGNVPLEKVNWTHVAKLKNRLNAEHTINKRKKGSCRRATVQKTIATLKAAWNRAIKRKLLAVNPFAEEKLGRVQAKQKRIFSAEEVELMVSAASSVWWEALIRLAFTTGLRLGEMLNLTWEDIDEAGGQITMSAKHVGTFPLGERTYPVLEWSAKSHQERCVPLCLDVAEKLQRLKLKSGGSRYVFLSLERLEVLGERQTAGKLGEPAHWVNNLGRDFRCLQERARKLLAQKRGFDIEQPGWEQKVEWRPGSIHDLRKSFGTMMARAISMHELQKLMGHANITTTAQYYLEVGDDLADRVRARFSGGGAAEPRLKQG